MSYRIGFDIGGTKIEVALLRFSGSAFEVVFRHRMPTEREKGYASIMDKVKTLFAMAASNLPTGQKLESVGVGLPGTVDPKTFNMLNGNTNAFVGHDLKKDFGKIFSEIKFTCANDANCFALAEALYGAGALYDKKNSLGLGVILGTGCGGGIIINGQVIEGKHGSAGEIGHSILVSNGRPCFCGRKGCVETYVSGTGLEKEYSEVSGKPLGGFHAHDIFVYAKSGDAAAVKAIDNYKHHLAEFLANMTNILDPDYIVLGGGVSLQDSIYEGLEKMIEDQRLAPVKSPRIFKNKLGDSAGVIGAALL